MACRPAPVRTIPSGWSRGSGGDRWWGRGSKACASSVGLTEEELAQLSGVSRNVLMDVEHGRRGLLHERLFDIAKALGVSAADLLRGYSLRTIE